jgi:hypothetical protein
MPTTATTLEGRLLCASGCAYAITQGESSLDPDAAAPYYAGVGFTRPPVTFRAGGEDINACLVGTSGDGVVVAFRGTLSLDGPFTLAKILDWVNNLNARPVDGAGLPGQVHEGFLGSLDSLWPDVRDEVKRQLSNTGATALLVAGHSKGGAVATLAAMRLQAQEALTPKVVTFAAPKSGNKAFTDAYNAAVDHTRYEFADDIVPHLPPSGSLLSVLATVSFFNRRLTSLARFDYERAGSLMYIERSLTVVADPNNALLDGRRQRLANLILTGHLQQIGDDHRSACGYGYMTALCPSGVCPPPVSPTA